MCTNDNVDRTSYSKKDKMGDASEYDSSAAILQPCTPMFYLRFFVVFPAVGLALARFCPRMSDARTGPSMISISLSSSAIVLIAFRLFDEPVPDPPTSKASTSITSPEVDAESRLNA